MGWRSPTAWFSRVGEELSPVAQEDVRAAAYDRLVVALGGQVKEIAGQELARSHGDSKEKGGPRSEYNPSDACCQARGHYTGRLYTPATARNSGIIQAPLCDMEDLPRAWYAGDALAWPEADLRRRSED
jgi:hypothetical protein